MERMKVSLWETITLCQTQVGWVGLLLSPRGVRALTYPCPCVEEALANLQKRWPEASFEEPAAQELKEELRWYYAGEPVTFSAKLDLEGYPPFQQRVWAATSRIPYGQTRTYSWI